MTEKVENVSTSPTRHEQIVTDDGRTIDVYYCKSCGYAYYGYEPLSCSKCESDAPSCECWSPPPY